MWWDDGERVPRPRSCRSHRLDALSVASFPLRYLKSVTGTPGSHGLSVVVFRGEPPQVLDDGFTGRPRAGQPALPHTVVSVPVRDDPVAVIGCHPLREPGEPVAALPVSWAVAFADPDSGPAAP